MTAGTSPTRAAVLEWMINYVAAVVDRPADPQTAEKTFPELGVDSAEVVIMTGVLEEEFAIEVRSELAFERPTISGFVDALVEHGVITA